MTIAALPAAALGAAIVCVPAITGHAPSASDAPSAATRAPAEPAVRGIAPQGGRRGTEVEVVVRGERLDTPLQVLLARPGIEVTALRSGDGGENGGKDAATRCTATLRIAADCPLGAHPLRLVTARGVANAVLFQVGALPEVAEQNAGKEPQTIALDTTVNGELQGEETDRYRFDLDAGQRVAAEIAAVRLGNGPIDLALQLAGPDGAIVASADDTALAQKDPWLRHVAAVAGTHELRVLAAFADDQNRGPYRLHVGTFPRPAVASPCGGAPGTSLRLDSVEGDERRAAEVALPEREQVFEFFPADDRGAAPSPILLRVGGPPPAQVATDDKGRAVAAWPGAVDGVIAAPDAVAKWFFTAKKGDGLEFVVFARSLRSPLDPVLVLRRGDGRFVAYDDDGAGNGDPRIRFTAPDDGEFSIEVRDLLRQGSPEHVFRLEAARPAREAAARLITGRRQDAQVSVPQGAGAGGVLQLENAEAGAELAFAGLPTGVRATFGPVGRGTVQVPFVLEAAADAALGGAWLALRSRTGEQPFGDAGYRQVLPLVTVRNDQPILDLVATELPIAIAGPARIALRVEPTRAPLVRGAPLGVPVAIVRQDGFDGEVRLRALWTPPGVGSGQVTIGKQQDRATLPLDGGGNAPIGAFPLAVVATWTERGEAFAATSPFATIEVAAPWLTATVERARTDAGVGTALQIALRAERALPGALSLRALSLPRGVTAQELTVPKDATSAVLPLQVAANAAVGRHRIVLEIAIDDAGTPVVHRQGGIELRIDPPRPAPSAAPAAPAAATGTGASR